MNLHRSNDMPDWESIDKKKYNFSQRVAVATGGIVTPGNVITIVGIVLVAVGLLEILKEQYWWGSILITVGRVCDLLDGWLAELTQTKSPLGELLDASIDKLGTVMAIAVLYVASLAPWWALTALLLPHVWITAVAFMARRKGKRLHPSRLGKISMALLWAAVFGFVLVRALGSDDIMWASTIVYGLSASSIVLSVSAALGYMSRKN